MADRVVKDLAVARFGQNLRHYRLQVCLAASPPMSGRAQNFAALNRRSSQSRRGVYGLSDQLKMDLRSHGCR
jgi:hypothetical protein